MRTTIAFDAASARTKDENGFLHVGLSNISKETVNPYYGREIPNWEKEGLDPEKIYNGYRTGDELAKAVSTFNGLPILFDHKMDSADAPLKSLRVGSVGTDTQYSAPYLKASLTFTDAEAIQAIEAGQKVELSSCYRYDPVFESGEFEGQQYDFRMSNIRGNHVALVDEGRAGSDVAVADSKLKPKNGANPMNKFKQALRAGAAKLRALAMDEALDPEKVEDALEVVRAEVQKAEGDPNPEAGGQDADPKADLIAKINALQIDDAAKQELLAAIENLGMDEEEKKPEDAIGAKDEDKPGEKPEEEKKPAAPAMDAKAIEQKIYERVAARDEALKVGKTLCGEINYLATDSAEDIYGKALTLRGVDIKAHPKSAYRSMVQMLASQSKATPPPAMDSRPSSTDLKGTPFANIGNIKLG